jgi:hypothetical protein
MLRISKSKPHYQNKFSRISLVPSLFFLSRSFQVYVQNIPLEYQNNAKLREFFSSASDGAVIDVHLAVECPNLQKKVLERDKIVANLEHAINIREITGVSPQVKNIITRAESGSLITSLGDELVDLNEEISETIELLKEVVNSTDMGVDVPQEEEDEISDYGSIDPSSPLAKQKAAEKAAEKGGVMGFAKSSYKGVKGAATNVTKGVAGVTKGVAGGALAVAGSGAHLAMSLLISEDGNVMSAGFVSFKSLRATHAALQMVYVMAIYLIVVWHVAHLAIVLRSLTCFVPVCSKSSQYSEPFAMEVREAPQPEGKQYTVPPSFSWMQKTKSSPSPSRFCDVPRYLLEKCW